MGDAAIQVESLSKLYRIGRRAHPYATLRDSLRALVSAPWRRLWPRPTASAGTIWALKDISFRMQPGEVVGVIGGNGAGKSTLLKILSRITEPTAGQAIINGRAGSLLEVGTGFHPELTGRDNIYLNGAILGMKHAEIKSRFDQIVAFAEVERFLDTPIKHYSTGMHVRLAFAVAAHLQAEILLIDEVLAYGDAAFQKKCLGKIEDVAKQGRTILFVSHNVSAVSRLCIRTIWIDCGRLQADGPSEQVIGQYLTAPAGLDGRSRWSPG